MRALHVYICLQGRNLPLRDTFRREPRRHAFQRLARHVDLDDFLGIIVDQIHAQTGDDLDNALGLQPIDSPPERGTAHSELTAELLDAYLVARAVTIPAQEKSAYEGIRIVAETGSPQLLHGLPAPVSKIIFRLR